MSQTTLFPSRLTRFAALILLFSLALTIRLYDLTDLPLDFHPTRQLLSAIKARGLYYETQPDGISTAKLEAGIRLAKLKADVEPVVFERLVAFTYRFTGEHIWIARIYSSLFWLIGGVFLFLLVHKTVSFDGALFSTAYYLFLPYAIIASRSFQPDPLMVTLTIIFWWMFACWVDLTSDSAPATRRTSWLYTLLAGLFGGAAIFIKFSSAFFVVGAALGLALSRFTLRDLLKNTQLWALAVLGALPSLIYLYEGVFHGRLGGQFSGRFFPALLINPLNYLHWAVNANLAAGGLFIMLGLLGFFLVKNKQLRGLMIDLWIGYVLYGMFFDYHIATHDYYHLPFIPIVALSLGSVGGWLAAHWPESTRGYERAALYVILLYGLFSVLWGVRDQMKSVDYRPEAAMWAEISNEMKGSGAVGLVPDYGDRLEYWGMRSITVWPSISDLKYSELRGGGRTFDALFKEYSNKKAFFLITDFNEFKQQTELKKKLAGYPIYAQNDGYVIYDLGNPISGTESKP